MIAECLEPTRLKYGPNKGKLPTYSWPGCYNLYYITADNAALCPKCANSDDCQKAEEWDKQWLLVAVEANYEDTSLYCEHCNERIEAAYEDN